MAQATGPTLETVLGEAFRVGAQVVLSSRVWSQARRQPEQALPKRKAWFNLELEELESANRTLEPWRKDVGRPLVLEVFLQPWGVEPQTLQGQVQAPVETLLEQWVFHYQPQLPHGHALTRSQVSRLNPTSIYKRLIIMLRSLFCYVRVLPAYRTFRDCKRQHGSNFSIGYRVSGTLPRRAAPALPPAVGASGSSSGRARSGAASSSSGRRSLQQFDFAPVDTPYGQFKVSVAYQPSSRVALLQQTTTPPPLPQLIADYMGGGSAGRAATVGQLPLRHAMSAQLLPQSAGGEPAATPPSQADVPRRATVGGASPSSSSGSGGGSLRRQSSALNPLRNPAWSSIRLSPNLLSGAAYSPHQQASPFAAAPPPYGSAPQPAPVHSPQLLRALSIQTASSASPHSRPPRPPQRAPELEGTSPVRHLGGQPIPQTRHRSASLHSRQQQEEGDEREGSEGAPGSSARQSSAPVSIPGCSEGRTRRLRSSGDLWGMHQHADVQKPLSAPAVSHLPSSGAQPESHGTGGTGSHTTDASLPQGPLLLPIVGPESESSGSAASSSLFPTSCSPQLPFAFTPSAQSLASHGSKGPMHDSTRNLERTSPHLRRTSSGAGAAAGGVSPAAAASTSWPFQGRGLGFSPQQHQYQYPTQAAAQQAAAQQEQARGALAQPQAGPPTREDVGREAQGSSAIVRHASWSSQSSSQQRKSSSGRGGGYSVSPMQDPLLESLLGSSTPRQYSSGGRGQSRSQASSSGASGGGGRGGTPLPLLTYPSTAPVRSRSGALGGAADVSPFGARAVSAPAGGFGSPAVVPQASGRALAPSPSAPPGAATGMLAASSSDAAVAAFVRLLGEAPPLHFDGGGGGESAAPWEGDGGAAGGSGGRLTLEAALRQFGLISQRLQSRGILSSVVDA